MRSSTQQLHAAANAGKPRPASHTLQTEENWQNKDCSGRQGVCRILCTSAKPTAGQTSALNPVPAIHGHESQPGSVVGKGGYGRRNSGNRALACSHEAIWEAQTLSTGPLRHISLARSLASSFRLLEPALSPSLLRLPTMVDRKGERVRCPLAAFECALFCALWRRPPAATRRALAPVVFGALEPAGRSMCLESCSRGGTPGRGF